MAVNTCDCRPMTDEEMKTLLHLMFLEKQDAASFMELCETVILATMF